MSILYTFTVKPCPEKMHFMWQIKHTRPGPGTKSQTALESENPHNMIPLRTHLRHMKHTEFHMRLSAGIGAVVLNLDHGVPYEHRRIDSVELLTRNKI
jgi:hypothetical protein